MAQSLPPAWLIDVTRSCARAGRRPTGIDRVEQAYIAHFLTRPEPVFGLLRTARGYLLLGAEAMGRLANHPEGAGQTPFEWLLWAREMALDRAWTPRLSAMLRRALPQGTAYLNVGHSLRRRGTLRALGRALGGRRIVMLHDAIPLDHPATQRPGARRRFARMLRLAGRDADLLIYPSQHAQARISRYLPGVRGAGAQVVAPLGTATFAAAPHDQATAQSPEPPFFLCVGTIEPRKNHLFLLDLWQDLQDDPAVAHCPELRICGARGWGCAEVIARLDALRAAPQSAPRAPIRELNDLDDTALGALYHGARGLLFASLDEGFGLPPAEAAAIGLPVLAAPLPALREHLGAQTLWLPAGDRAAWKAAVLSLAAHTPALRYAPQPRPRWADHFKIVLSHL